MSGGGRGSGQGAVLNGYCPAAIHVAELGVWEEDGKAWCPGITLHPPPPFCSLGVWRKEEIHSPESFLSGKHQ